MMIVCASLELAVERLKYILAETHNHPVFIEVAKLAVLGWRLIALDVKIVEVECDEAFTACYLK